MFEGIKSWFAGGDKDEEEVVDTGKVPANGGGTKSNFRISKPYGYFMEDVDDAVREFRSTIVSKEKIIHKLEASLQEYKKQILQMQFEMSTMEVPSMSDDAGQSIISAAESKLNVRPNEVVKRRKDRLTPLSESTDDSVDVIFD